jgi:hypothetical protein
MFFYQRFVFEAILTKLIAELQSQLRSATNVRAYSTDWYVSDAQNHAKHATMYKRDVLK